MQLETITVLLPWSLPVLIIGTIPTSNWIGFFFKTGLFLFGSTQRELGHPGARLQAGAALIAVFLFTTPLLAAILRSIV